MPPNSAHILIVEDNAVLAHDLADELESRGILRIQIVASMRDAVRAVSDCLPDIAIVDLTLSDGQTGAQLARALARSGVKICILSGRQALAPELMAIAHTFIAKPTPSHVVADVIEGDIKSIALRDPASGIAPATEVAEPRGGISDDVPSASRDAGHDTGGAARSYELNRAEPYRGARSCLSRTDHRTDA